MTSWLNRLTSHKHNSAGEAKDRLKLVLIHDRTNLTSDELVSLKNELIQVISRYVAIDTPAVRIDINHDGREQRLIADIPLRASPRRKIG
jgi:cell division topological specificity factor